MIGAAHEKAARLLPVPPILRRRAGRLGDLIDRHRSFPVTSHAIGWLLGSLTVDSTAITRATGYRPPPMAEEDLKAAARCYLALRTMGDGR